MTRTFCLGEPPEELVRYHALVREALDLACATIRPGVTGAEAHRVVCELFEAQGYRTQLSKEPGEVLDEGFFHSLGHGVGLEAHEPPGTGCVGEAIVAGDVLAVEPGLYRTGFGGCRLDDLVLVTEDGCEVLTDFPDELVALAQGACQALTGPITLTGGMRRSRVIGGLGGSAAAALIARARIPGRPGRRERRAGAASRLALPAS